MKDKDKTKKQLLVELQELKQQLERLKRSEIKSEPIKGETTLEGLTNKKMKTHSALEENQEVIGYLKESRLFTHLPTELLNQLLPLTEVSDIPMGTEILKEGDSNSKVYFLIEGRVGVYVENHLILELHRKGDIFGEMSMISHKPCAASVIAESHIRVFSIKSKDIGQYTDIDTDTLHHILYRIFSMILSEKLVVTTIKAKEYEINHQKLLKEISERKQAEEKTKEGQIQLQNIIDNVPALIAFISNKEVYRYVNSQDSKYTDFRPTDIIGRTVKDVLGTKNYEQVKIKVQQVLSGKIVNFDSYMTFKNRNHIYRVTYVPYFNKGKQDGFFSLALDVTEQKKLEDQLRQSQKMEAIGVLTGGIAHEFNNLLVPIFVHTTMLMEGKSKDDPALNGLVQIQRAGRKAKDLVQQLLAYGRKSFSTRASVPFETVVEDTIKLLKNTTPANISIKKEIGDDLPPALGMPSEIHQVLLNLCINATHAMPEGGELTIHLKSVNHHKFINSEGEQREGKFINLMIQDTGVGMDQTTLERIYDPFFTTKEIGKGTGLGLSVVQGIVEQHEGHIEVESKLGEGTTFHLYFPALQQNRVETPVVKPQPLSQGNEHILLIDDKPMVTKPAKSALESLGYKVTYFLDSAEALQSFADHPHDFDLVMTDYGMPKMNGKQLAEKVKEIRPGIPIILLTGYGDLVAKENIHLWGIDDLLMKPFQLKELSDVLRGVLDKR